MTDTDSENSWLTESETGVQDSGTGDVFAGMGQVQAASGSDVLANGMEILRFALDMSEFAGEFSQNCQDGILTPMSGGAGGIGASNLRHSRDFEAAHRIAIQGLTQQLGEIGASFMAIGMAAQAVTVEYLNADGDGGLNIDAVYGTKLSDGQHALFETKDGKLGLSDEAMTDEQKQESKAAKEAEEALEDLLAAEGDPHVDPSKVAPPSMGAEPLSEDNCENQGEDSGNCLLPGSGMVLEGGDGVPENGPLRQQYGEGIVIAEDDEGVEV